MKKNKMQNHILSFQNNKGFTTVLLILVTQIVIFTMFFAYSPLVTQLHRLAKSNREFDIAHIVGEELGARIGDAYNDGYNTLTNPKDIVAYCGGIEGVIPRRGAVLKLTNPGGEYVFLCIPDDGIRIKHPLLSSRFVVFGHRESANKYTFDNWLRLVDDLGEFAVYKKQQPIEHHYKMNLLLNVIGPQAIANEGNLIPNVANPTNEIQAKTAARIIFEPVSPLPFNAIIDTVVSKPGSPAFPGSVSVENINCRTSHHCIAYKFCTRVNQEEVPCSEEEFVWQMVAMPRLPKETVGAPGS